MSMRIAGDWLASHPQVKDRAAESLGHSREQIQDVIANDLHRIVDYAEAILNSSVEYDAPPEVQEQLTEFRKRVADGMTAEKNDPFVQKTLASLVGLRNFHEIRLVLRGALPHAPNETSRELVNRLIITAGDPTTQGIESGGSTVACLLACLVCGELFCLECCIIAF